MLNSLVYTYFLFCPFLVAVAQQYEIKFQRPPSGRRDTITLFCRTSDGTRLNVERNTSITFWVNRTLGVRDSESDLRRIVDLPGKEISGEEFVFHLTPELEGNYTCGRVTGEINAMESTNYISLISFERNDRARSKHIAIESGGTAVLPCPIEVGKLSSCYYGNWYNSTTLISTVDHPGVHCVSPKASESSPANKYSVNVHDRFSLTIFSALPSDSGEYYCMLLSSNPATDSGSVVQYGNSVPVSLSVGAAPLISEGPKDVVVKDIPSHASFNCTVAGKPLLPITWTYTATLAGKQPLTAENSEVITTNLTNDDSGRSRVVSTLRLSITPTDGGTVTCTTGDTESTARLTVLGAPTHITHLTTSDGNIIYTVTLPVRLNRPARLNITYVRGQNEVLLPKVVTSPPMEYSDTDSIVYHENKDTLPTTKYRVQAALYIDVGSQVLQGPASLSSETIDAGGLSREAEIGISVGVSVFVITIVIFLAVIVIIIVIAKVRRRKRKAAPLIGKLSGMLETLHNAGDVDSPGYKAQLRNAIQVLRNIQDTLHICSDSASGADEQADNAELLEEFKSSLKSTLSMVERLDSQEKE